MILEYFALDLALKVGHYTEAVNLWKKLFKRKGKDFTVGHKRGCGCRR